eukprot:3868930-Pleurochrysis_carterae.AAC.1
MREDSTTKYLQNIFTAEVDGDRTELRPIRVQYTSPSMYKLLLEDGSSVFAVCNAKEEDPPGFFYTRVKALAKREIRNMRTLKARRETAKEALGCIEMDLKNITIPNFVQALGVFADIPEVDHPTLMWNPSFFLHACD